MIRKEIDILVQATSKGCAVVEKASNMLWDRDAIMEARDSGAFQAKVRLLPPGGQIEVSAVYPGCLHQAGAIPDALKYRMIAQTEHFVIFAPSPEG